MKKGARLFYITTERYYVLLNTMTDFKGSLKVAILGLCVVLTGAYSIVAARSCYHPVDMDFVLLHIKFKASLTISV